MFDSLSPLPQDPILGLLAAFREDTNPSKVDLGVGVYKNEAGQTPIMASVKRAEALYIAQEDSKAYVGPAGDPAFNQGMEQLLYGAGHKALLENRVRTVQTPGGCGALRLAGEFIHRCNDAATLWVSDPTWANHIPLFSNAGLTIKTYPYYDAETKGIRFDAMMACLQKLGPNDVVLLHGCCHNPTGADLNNEQWLAIADLAEAKGFLPLVDIAYQGFGSGLDDDAFGVRLLADRLPELIVAASCSKNFGVYRERVGALSLVSSTPTQADTSLSQVLNLSRGNYSMPPSHGAAVVGTIFQNEALTAEWKSELTAMRERMNSLRVLLVDQLTAKGAGSRFDHIAAQNGMFSFLGLSVEQVQRLGKEYSVYLVNSSRINVAGISEANIAYLSNSIVSVL
ncbi:aromatic amino acid transaminase [Dasania marina]|uniref:amino acid aminotransferase n=1 Tax=Dasania marina TaxID=471499 RepID=UPI000361B8B9|nr:amino acid aminotransferase [Dasania marina]